METYFQRGLRWLGSRLPATKKDLNEGIWFMAGEIKAAGAAVNAHLDKVAVAVDGLVGDVDFLKSEIARLQSTSGQITAEDQAILDGIQSRTNALATKIEALDAATENQPTVPPDDGGGTQPDLPPNP